MNPDPPPAPAAIAASRAGWITPRHALVGFLAALAATALLGILGITDVISDSRALGVSATMAVGCVALLMLAFIAERWGFVVWMRLGMLAAALGVVDACYLIWSAPLARVDPQEAFWQLLGCTSIVVAGTIVCGAVLGPRGRGRWLRAMQRAIASTVILWGALGLVSIIWPEAVWDFIRNLLGASLEWAIRAFIASLVLAAAGTAALPVLLRLQALSVADSGGTAIRGRKVLIRLVCPRCGTENSIAANSREVCTRCALEVRVQVEEPRCTCGYLSYGLEGNTCPECGRPVAHGTGWGQPPTPSPAPPSP